MIYCPKCGTANRQGSRFCNECGASLPPHTGLRCPMCGTMNPVGNVYCDKCNARLLPAAQDQPEEEEKKEQPSRGPVKGLSLPTIPLDEEADQEGTEPAPESGEDWLDQLRATADGGEEAELAAPSSPDEFEDVDLPDWIAGTESPSEDEEETPAEEPEWMAQLGMASQPEEPASEEAEGKPDWLAGLEQEGAAQEDEAPPFAAEETYQTPDWLAGLEAEEPPQMESEASPFAAEQPAEEPAEIPDWLAGLEAEEPPQAAPETETPPAAEQPAEEPAEIPDWLAGLEAEEPPQAAPETETPPAAEQPAEKSAEIPDWLAGLEAEEPPQATPETETPPAAEQPAEESAEIPDWLAGLEAEEPPQATPETEAEALLPTTGEVPDWLAAMAGERPPQPEEPPPDAQERVEKTATDVSEWLTELEPGPSTPAASGDELPPFTEEEEIVPSLEGETVPDWLAQMGSGETQDERASTERVAEPSPPSPGPEGLVPAEIPEWLEALRPSEEPESAVEEPMETDGLLEGLRGTLLPSPSIKMPEREGPVAPGGSSPAAVARAELLQELLGRSATAPQPVEEKRGRQLGWAVHRIVIGLLLILAILAPMAITLPPVFSEPSSPAASRVFEAIEQNVGPGSVVLVAFEYRPAEVDEMNPIAHPVLRHLLQQGAHVAVATTQPEGTALAEALLSQMPEAEGRGQQVTMLGYRPGEAASVRSFLSSLGEDVEGIDTAADAALVVVLAARADGLRSWVEQTTLSYPDLPLAAGVSARLEPLAAPYLDPDAGQLAGLVAGWPGAAVYEQHLGAGGPVAFYLDSLGLAQLVLVGLMLVGALVFLVGGQRR